METKKSIYNEVAISFYDDIKGHWTIDTWKTKDNEEEGVVVGTINLKGEINWIVEEAKNDSLVKREIKRFFEAKLFSIKDTDIIEEKLFDMFKSIHNGEEKYFNVIFHGGCVNYGCEKRYLLESMSFIFGMVGNGRFIVISEVTDEELEDAPKLLIEDIASAVGEVFVIDIE